jgi:hypothetical protein
VWFNPARPPWRLLGDAKVYRPASTGHMSFA